MTYLDDDAILRRAFSLTPDTLDFEAQRVTLHTQWFESAAWSILPGAERYGCPAHGVSFAPTSEPPHVGELDVADVAIQENRRFRVATFAPRGAGPAPGAIILVHGLNERDFAKYLPWATRLVQATGKAVVLFPLAFHMNRAPGSWSHPRRMRLVSRERESRSPSIVNSTLANAAISTRLEANPRRFCWSGLQSLCDIAQFVDEVHEGRHPSIATSARIDLFGYSIGAFLCEILLMANYRGRFAESRLFMFCGGATVDRTYPNSRYILDSDATIALYSFFLARFESELARDARLAHFLGDLHVEGSYFRAMLNYQDGKAQREARLRELTGRIAALGLRQDTVVPASEIANTLQGDFREIPIPVEVEDFDYDYDHISPFPLSAPRAKVEPCFDRVFDRAARHFV